MSVQKRPNGKWQARVLVNGRHLSRDFTTKGLAEAWESRQRDRKRLGPQLAAQLERENVTWGEYTGADGAWRDHAATFTQPTRDKYRWALDKWLADLDHEPMLAIDTDLMRKVQANMLKMGASPKTVKEVLAKASAIFETAIPGYVERNPVKSVRRPPVEINDDINIAMPAELEALIASLTGRDRAIAILGGRAGLSPKEVRLVQCNDFDGERLTIHKSRTKTSRARTRLVQLDRLSRQQLKEWLMESGHRDADRIIGDMTENALKLWGRVKLPHDMRVTDLRHSHASALHHTLMTQPAILDRLGHGFQAHWRHYAHVVAAIKPEQRYADLEALYSAARAQAAAQHMRNPAASV